jgi:hypothetical protein
MRNLGLTSISVRLIASMCWNYPPAPWEPVPSVPCFGPSPLWELGGNSSTSICLIAFRAEGDTGAGRNGSAPPC